MQAIISFNSSDKKETLKYGEIEKKSNICSNFINLLSLDTNYIEKEIIKKIDYFDIKSIKKAYKQIYRLHPLLLLDEFNMIDYIDQYSDFSQKINNINCDISNLKSLISNQKDSNNNKYISNLNSALDYLIKKKNTYRKVSNSVKKYVSTVFRLIVNRINSYKDIVNICFVENNNEFFPGFSDLTPLKKFVYYTYFVQKKNIPFDNLPTSSIDFTFDCSAEKFNKKLKNNIKNANSFDLLFSEGISPMYRYDCKTLEQFLQVSLFTCLTLDLNIKKCKNCKKYFIAYQRSDEKYCNRKSPQDKNKTCKQYSNLENWKNNINSKEELKIYRRIYMAKQMQTRRNPDKINLKNNFETWKRDAQHMRNKYVHGIISKQDFLSWLHRNS